MEALESYHVLNFESELDVKSASRSREIERALKAMIRLMATLRPDLYAPVRRGARIHTPSGRQATMYVKDGKPTLTKKDEPDRIPYIVDIAVPEEALPGNKDAYRAMNVRVHKWMSFVTGTEASALNLALYWAYPIMAPRLENLWCFYGQGGNGKGLLFGGFRRISTAGAARSTSNACHRAASTAATRRANWSTPYGSPTLNPTCRARHAPAR